jgi:NAD dependent epimerase/dehydratase
VGKVFKKILVTGAGGFIGSHLTEELVRSGHKVRAFVHYNSFNRWGWLDYLPDEITGQLEIFTGDIRDPHGVRKALEGVDCVFHLAALIGIPYSYHSPASYLETNIQGTLNLLQGIRESEVKKFIHTSTSEIYGTAQFVPITEDHPVNPQSPYAATKSGADFLALSFFRSFGSPVVVVRPFNTYGPRQSARAIIPTIITQVLSGQKTIRLGSLTPTRDLNFVRDTVRGFIRAAETDGILGQVFNLGTNHEISVGNLAGTIAKIMNTTVEIVSETERTRPENSEVDRLLADNTKALELLHWAPEYTLQTGLEETVAWFSRKETMNMYKANIYNI